MEERTFYEQSQMNQEGDNMESLLKNEDGFITELYDK